MVDMAEINKIKAIDKDHNYFVHLLDTPIRLKKEGKLSNYLVSVKDCICVKGVLSRAGSKILDGYVPLFNSTVVQKCLDEGATIIGKTAQDEFGFGSFNANTFLPVPKNYLDKTRSCGGSSGGACGFTKAASLNGLNHIAIAESTGGSIVNPASFCGVFGLSPTYGLVSRYGLIDYGNSLDKIGPVSSTMKDIAKMLTVISGEDEKDSTSLNSDVKDYESFLVDVNVSLEGMKIGILKESHKPDVNKGVVSQLDKCVHKLKQKGVVCEEIVLPSLKYSLSAYYILAMSESSTNLAKYCGLRYGKSEPLYGEFNEYFSEVRSKYFYSETKRRIILGTFVRMAAQREAYYIKAAKIRTKIINEYKEMFQRYDLVLSPTMPIVAPRFEDIEKLTPVQHYMMDFFTVGPNLAGLPHLNVPFGLSDELPVGLMFVADHLKEELLIKIGSFIESMGCD
jgi:aspartyl-tRNA(Asn)/glutamyl-tRNA(Gln) amidotransferase subunit A